PASLIVTPDNLPNASGYPVGSATGYDIQVGPAGLPFTVQTSANSASWLSVSPASGVAPATVHVVIDPSKATYGSYHDGITSVTPGAPNSRVAGPGQMILSSFIAQLPQQTNGATGAGPDHTVAPNELAKLQLSDFACGTKPVVTINGTPVSWSAFDSGVI